MIVLLAALLAGIPLQEPPRVPEGWTVELAAAPPLVERPVMAGFDGRGRLYVGDSAGVNLRFEDLEKAPPHRILRLEDSDGDGRFDRQTVFADRITFPMGALWHRDALYVCAPPSVWRLADTDDDGVADHRKELVTRFGSNGNAADIHGPFLGPDGRIWWTDGRHGHSIEQPNGPRLQGKAARIFRCRPDGTDVEVVAGGGMDNPVEIAFTGEGEAVVSVALLHAQPSRIDALIYAIEGGVYPYHDVLREFRRTGDLLPSLVDVGWVAPSGLVRIRGGAFPPNTLLGAHFNTREVVRHALERDGAGFRARTEPFLKSDHPDFHPTDVVEDADGSLLVLDTGGWFRIGCPTSRVDKPQAKGAIWRLRRKDAPRIEDPWGLKSSGGLDDPRFAVRDRAVEDAKDPALLKAATPRARRNAVWGLSRNGVPVREALSDPDVSVRQSAARATGFLKDREALNPLIDLLDDDAAPVKREAALALARLKDPRAAGPLLAALGRGGDRFLEHAMIWALLEIGDAAAVRRGLKEAPRAALIVLDQLPDGGLTPAETAALLAGADAALQREVLRVLTARGWTAEIAGMLAAWLKEPSPRAELGGTIAAFSSDPAVQDLAARALRDAGTGVEVRVAVLEAMALSPPERMPATWTAELRWSLDHADPRVVRLAVAALRAADAVDVDARLLELAGDASRDEELRVEAAQAAAPRTAKLDGPLFGFLRECLAPAKPPLLRLAAATALGSAGLSDEQRTRLAANVAEAGPLELPRLLAAFERGGNKALAAALAKSAALDAVPPDLLRRVVNALPAELRKDAGPLLKRAEGDGREKLAALASALEGGDAAVGREVFHGPKAACSACHRAGGPGGLVGPDLSRIGGIRAPKDLLESIVLPSASFARGYEPVAIRTKDGLVLDGVVARETPDALLLVQADRTERRVARASIADLRQSRTSIMPQGLAGVLSPSELRDLIAFLASLR
jgi:putative membrane-bound dehydrogenase-like protein